MNRRNSPDHATHDELLLARFYGHDLDGRELRETEERIASCPGCAAFVDELASIASATRTLPVPPRPRDFSLTQADAERLGRRRAAASAGGLFGWLGRSRALGGSMVAVSLAGFLVVGALSAISFGTATSATAPDSPAYGPLAAADATAAPTAAPASLTGANSGGSESVASVPSAGDSSKALPSYAPRPSAEPSPAVSLAAASPIMALQSPLTRSAGPIAAVSPWSSGQVDDNAASPSDAVRYGAGGKTGESPVVQGINGQGGSVAGQPDGRSVVLAAFGLLLALGLLVLVGPLAFAWAVDRRRS